MAAEQITSRTNPLMTHIRHLASSAYRAAQGEFLCDSPKLLREAVQWNAPIKTVVFTPDAELPSLEARLVCVPADVMKSVSPLESPQGVLFTCALPAAAGPDKLTGQRYMVLDGVQDPGNVGTILRTLDAFDFDGLLLLEGCADAYGVKAVRASMGAVFRRPIYRLTADELPALLEKSGLPLYGTALRQDTEDVRGVDLSRCAIAIGSEGRGLTDKVLTICRKTLRIPMSPRCESLNAAIAATVLLWESYRKL